MAPWRRTQTGLTLAIRLTPRGGRDGLDGVAHLADGREIMKIRVRAAPTDGQANAALLAVLAGLFDRPRSAVTLIGGATARVKTVAVSGPPDALAARIAGLLEEAGDKAS